LLFTENKLAAIVAGITFSAINMIERMMTILTIILIIIGVIFVLIVFKTIIASLTTRKILKNKSLDEIIDFIASINQNKLTPFMRLTIAVGRKDVLSFLLSKDFRDDDGETLLHRAAMSGNTDIAKFLIDNGADVNAKGFKDSRPLHWACLFKQFDVAKLLLDSGADVNAFNYKQTPIFYAVHQKHIELVNLLIKRGASVDIKNRRKLGVLSASIFMRKKMADLLKKHGAIGD